MIVSAVAANVMNASFTSLLICLFLQTACKKPIAPVTVMELSGRPLAGVSIILGRDSAVPFQGKTNNEGTAVSDKLRGHGSLIVSHMGVILRKEMEKSDWPYRVIWPVTIPEKNNPTDTFTCTIRVRLADGKPVPGLTAHIAHEPHKNPGGGNKPLMLTDGTTVQASLEGTVYLSFETTKTTISVQFPECPFRQPFDITWPE